MKPTNPKNMGTGVPGEFIMLAVNLPPIPGTTPAQSTAVMDFDKVKHLLPDTPLRHQKQGPLPELSDEDAEDLAECERRLADPAEKPIPFDDVCRELGLE